MCVVWASGLQAQQFHSVDALLSICTTFECITVLWYIPCGASLLWSFNAFWNKNQTSNLLISLGVMNYGLDSFV